MKKLLGIDEAGRGCVAGPLCVAGVVFNSSIDGLTDSKKLSFAKREKLFPLIQKNSSYHIVFKSAYEVDTKGISTCIREALEEIKTTLCHDRVIFDGNSTFGVVGIDTMIKADLHIPEVSAASILAKVSRDRYMIELSSRFPDYHFEKHKGYGTKAHVELIKKYGYTDEHRKSYKIKALDFSQGTLF